MAAGAGTAPVPRDELVAIVRQAVAAEMDARRNIDERTHADHHRYVERCIQRDARRADNLEAVKRQVLGWGLVSAVGGVGYGAFELIKAFVKGLRP